MGTFIIGKNEQMIAGIPVGRLNDLDTRVHVLEAAGGGSITVQDIDGNPTVNNVTTIKFTNGAVTDDGAGVVSVTTGSGGGGDVSSNTGTSVDSEIALFSGTGGKTIKRATTTGLLKGTSGVISAATAGTDYVTADSTNTFTNKTFNADGTGNSITNIENADIKAAAAIALNKLAATTVSRALVSDGSGFVSAATTTSTEIGFLNGVTSAIQTQIDGKQATGNYVTALTGDVTASGPGSVAATLATVNSNVGSFTNANITVNAKGLITAASNGSGGSGVTVETPTGSVDGSNVTFTVTAEPKWVVADTSTYFDGAGYTYAALTITMDSAPVSFIRNIY